MIEMFRKIIYVFDKKGRIKLALLTTIILISTLLETIGVAAIIPFISAIMFPEKVMDNKYGAMVYQLLGLETTNEFVIVLSIMLIVIYLFKNIFYIIMNELQYRFIFGNQHRLSCEMLQHYMKRDYLFHTAHNSAELRNNIGTDVDTFFVMLLTMIQLVTEIFVCITIAGVLVVIDKTITIAIAIMLTLSVSIFAKIYRRKIKDFGQERRKYSIKMTKCLDQSFGGIKEIKILNKEQYFINNYKEANSQYVKNRKKYTLYSITPKPVLEAICVVSLMAVIIFKIQRGVAIEYFIPTLSVFAMAAIRLLPSFGKMAALLSSIMFSKASVDALYKDLMEIKSNEEEVERIWRVNDDLPFENDIEIRGVEFQYPGTDKPVLNNVTFQIKKNQAIAFVGASGAGKTTLADIILGLLEPNTGSVYVDGQDVFASMDAWHKKLGYIPQNIYLMDDTIRNNIAFGKEQVNVSDEDIWKALEGAQLSEFVKGLEKGLDTEIGERGVRFSGGQRQRIGIARALYYNAEVLILDEATSALDNETEKAVMDAIEHLAGKKTLIIIAHRLSTIENCDVVYQVANNNVLRRVE